MLGDDVLRPHPRMHLAVWTGLPVRRKLAMAMAAKSFLLLFLAFGILFWLGRDLEVEEIGGGLRDKTAFLAALIAPQVALEFDAGGRPQLASRAPLENVLIPALTHDRRIRQIGLFCFIGDRPMLLDAFTLRVDTAQAGAVLALDTSSVLLRDARHAAYMDSGARRRGSTSVFTAYAPLRVPGGDRSLVLTLDADPRLLFRGTDFFRPVLVLILIAGTLVAFILSQWLAEPFTRPIDRLVVATESVARGDFTVQVPVTGGIELESLADAFNRMTQTVRRHQADLEGNNRQLDSLNHQLRETMAKLEKVNSELADSRNFFSTLVARTPTPTVVTDPEGRILLFNEAAHQLFGWDVHDIVGQPWDRIFSPDNRPELRAGLERDIRLGRVWQGECLGRTRAGQAPLLDVTVSPVPDDQGAILAFMLLTQDVTEKRQLQNLIIQMERMSTRGEMAGEIAHEINNYLTILAGNLDVLPMLLTSGDHQKVERKFAAMREVLDKIARFSDGLMGYREGETEFTRCDINRLIEGLVAFLKPQTRYAGILVHLHLDPTVPTILADVGQIQQVLVNLLNNAADAIQEHGRGDGRIELTTSWQPRGGGIHIAVADNGCGIPAAVVGRLFRDRYTSKSSGHGLGLLNCRRIAQGHGGRLEVESREGQGATFTLTLPVGENTEILPPPLVRTSSDLGFDAAAKPLRSDRG